MEDDMPPISVNRAAKLPPFWLANPAAWFTTADGTFKLWVITDKGSRFFNCLHTLLEAGMVFIDDHLLEVVPIPANTYTELCCCLLAAHQLMDIQGVEQIHQMSPLATQKPSELLAEMLRLCPRGTGEQ
jgi:hypothetical protein